MLVILVFIIASLIMVFLQRKTIWFSNRLVLGGTYVVIVFLLLGLSTLFPKLLYFNERFPSHTDWSLKETIQNDDAVIFLYQKEGYNDNLYYDVLVFQKTSVFTLNKPGKDFVKYQIYEYNGDDSTYHDNKAQTLAYDIGNDKYLIYLELYDGQTLEVSDITFGGEAVEFQVSETDPTMIFFISNQSSADLTVNNVSFQVWNYG